MAEVPVAPKLADKGPKLADKGPKLADKGPKLADKGSNGSVNGAAHLVAQDIFRQASGLGGVLVVAFVAPIPPSPSASSNGASPRALAIRALARKAEARDREAEASQRVADESDRELVREAIKALRGAEPGRAPKVVNEANPRRSRETNWETPVATDTPKVRRSSSKAEKK